jgi:hypothetical protein
MFSFLKRSSQVRSEHDFSDTLPLEPVEPAAPVLSTPRPASPVNDLSVGDVIEGNQDADWTAWQDSVSFQDSQFPADLAEPEQPAPAKIQTSQDAQDAFAWVGKNAA